LQANYLNISAADQAQEVYASDGYGGSQMLARVRAGLRRWHGSRCASALQHHRRFPDLSFRNFIPSTSCEIEIRK